MNRPKARNKIKMTSVMMDTTKTHRKMAVKKMNRKRALLMNWTRLIYLVQNKRNNKAANKIKNTKLKTKSSPTNKLYLDKRTNRMRKAINNTIRINVQIRIKVNNRNRTSLRNFLFHLPKIIKGPNSQSSPLNSQHPPEKILKRKSN